MLVDKPKWENMLETYQPLTFAGRRLRVKFLLRDMAFNLNTTSWLSKVATAIASLLCIWRSTSPSPICLLISSPNCNKTKLTEFLQVFQGSCSWIEKMEDNLTSVDPLSYWNNGSRLDLVASLVVVPLACTTPLKSFLWSNAGQGTSNSYNEISNPDALMSRNEHMNHFASLFVGTKCPWNESNSEGDMRRILPKH